MDRFSAIVQQQGGGTAAARASSSSSSSAGKGSTHGSHGGRCRTGSHASSPSSSFGKDGGIGGSVKILSRQDRRGEEVGPNTGGSLRGALIFGAPPTQHPMTGQPECHQPTIPHIRPPTKPISVQTLQTRHGQQNQRDTQIQLVP